MSHESQWLTVKELREPFNDAINYKSRHDKEFFSKIFLKTDAVEACLKPAIYYLMGEKGAGKTAFAVYLENYSIKDKKCKVTTMTETQYKRFIALKQKGKLDYSDYANIWRPMLLIIISQMIIEKSKSILNSITGKFSAVEKEIKQWNKSALNPEIESAFEILNLSSSKGEIKSKNRGGISIESESKKTESLTTIKHNLFDRETSLKDAISDLKLANDHILFFDGIDYRPESVPYSEYRECIKGIGEAVWQLNTEFFNNIRDSKGRIKIVLLVRPDVFHALNLYNSNSRLQDNCVFLDWSTTEREYRDSILFEASQKYFSSQQTSSLASEPAWDHYFGSVEEGKNVFRQLLKTTFQKPRDILTFIRLIREMQVKSGEGNQTKFKTGVIWDATFTKKFSDYMLGEVRNYAAFYMVPEDFEIYIKFFQYLDGQSTFDMERFNIAFGKFKQWAIGEKIKAHEYLRDSEALLQLFYDINLIGYKEGSNSDTENFYHWSFRERTVNNIAPKVKSSGNLMINPGASKALDIGKRMNNQNSVSAKSTSKPALARKRNRKPKRSYGQS